MRFSTPDTALDIDIQHLIVAGWTGRDDAAVKHHIAELAAIGVNPPSQVPLFYRVSAKLMVQGPIIQVLGNTTSGEVEPVLVRAGGTTWLGLGSDQTDRALEVVSVAASKQACPKPVSNQLWPLDDVAGHLDDLILRCHVQENGNWGLYQEGTLASILPLPDLAQRAAMGDNSAMFCGTLGAIGPVRPAPAYRMDLIDQALNRSLALEYRVQCLPVVE